MEEQKYVVKKETSKSTVMEKYNEQKHGKLMKMDSLEVSESTS